MLFGVELVQHIQHPAAESLGYRRAGKHGHEVAAAKGEDAGGDGQIDRVGDFNDLRHLRCELFRVALVDSSNRTLVRITEGTRQLYRANPGAVLVGDRGQGDAVEGKGHFHDTNS